MPTERELKIRVAMRLGDSSRTTRSLYAIIGVQNHTGLQNDRHRVHSHTLRDFNMEVPGLELLNDTPRMSMFRARRKLRRLANNTSIALSRPKIPRSPLRGRHTATAEPDTSGKG